MTGRNPIYYKTLMKCKYIEHHMDYQRPRLKVLSDYYEGKTKNLVELTRRKEEYMADNRSA